MPQGRLQDYIRGGGGDEGKQGEGGSSCSEWFFFAPFSRFYSVEGTKLKFAKKSFAIFFTFFWLMNGLPGCEEGHQEPYSGDLKTPQYHKLA